MAIINPTISANAADSPSNKLLLEKLSQIPGICVSTYASRPLGGLVFEVAVEEGNLKAEMAVYRAEMEVYDRFEDARFELYVV